MRGQRTGELVYTICAGIEVVAAIFDAVAGSWANAISAACFGFCLYMIGVLGTRAARKWGWLDGRREMVNSIAEAARRGMALRDWMIAQAERDQAVLAGKVRP